MIPLPVISRELLAAARQPFTYWLRVLGAGALLASCALVAWFQSDQSRLGGRLFAALHGTLLVATWILVPLLTADTISHERREGTLPLLFLTSLKPGDIILAKSTAQGLRAFTLWLAALPILTIPFIVGGVSWLEATFSVLVNLSSLWLAMAAGLVGSACCKVWMRSLAVAGCLSFLLVLALLMTLGNLIAAVIPTAFPGANPGGQFADVLELGFDLLTDKDMMWPQMLSGSAVGYGPFLRSYLVMGALSLLFFFALLRFAAWKVTRVWREEPSSARVVRLQRKFCTPVFFLGWFRNWMRFELEHNPIGWLERRTWTGRLVTWSWLAVVVSIYSSFLANWELYQHRFQELQLFLAWLLIGSLAVSAAASFRRERETGVLELLLVAPLREWHIISGRLRGLWGQFFPALAMLCWAWVYCGSFLSGAGFLRTVFFFIIAYLTLPVIGLYYSLAVPSFISALVRTLVAGIVLPLVLARVGELAKLLLWVGGNSNVQFWSNAEDWLLPPEPMQVGLALFYAWRLHCDLKARAFVCAGRTC